MSLPNLPFAVFDEFGKSCEDRVADHYRAAVEAALRDAPQQAEPVAIYHGRCTIDCGEHGHHDIELLKMIPKGARLYTSPSAPTAVEPTGEDSTVVEPRDEDRYQLLRRGQHWSVIDGVGDVLRGDDLDVAIDSILAARASKGTR